MNLSRGNAEYYRDMFNGTKTLYACIKSTIIPLVKLLGWLNSKSRNEKHSFLFFGINTGIQN